jgi:hypothetical protein
MDQMVFPFDYSARNRKTLSAAIPKSWLFAKAHFARVALEAIGDGQQLHPPSDPTPHTVLRPFMIHAPAPEIMFQQLNSRSIYERDKQS